jgi:predicted HTH transcriptional regulator
MKQEYDFTKMCSKPNPYASLNMVRRCLEAGLPEPKFEVRDGFVSVIYRKTNKLSAESVKGIKNDTKNENIKVNQSQKKILARLARKSHLTVPELAISVGITEVNIKKNIASLRAADLLERVGSNRQGYWLVKGRSQ